MNSRTGKNFKVPVIVTDLPHLVMVRIFSFLPAKDLVSVQGVCNLWKSMTMNTYVWKNSPVSMRCFTIQELTGIPYFHSICGAVENGNEFFDTLTNNVTDLREIDCAMTDVSPVIFKQCIKKFRNLESISINNFTPGFLESLDVLSTCSNLKKVDFIFEEDSNNFSQFCEAIGDGFLALKSLRLIPICHIGGYQCDVTNLLKKKLAQLTDLSFLSPEVDPTVVDLVLKSTKMKCLNIVALDVPKHSLDLGCMTGLKTLTLNFLHIFKPSNYACVDAYKRIVLPPNLQSLELNCPESSEAYTGIIHKILSSASHLKRLSISNVPDADINQQLEKINHLLSLHTVCLEKLSHLSSKGVEHVLKCTELRSFCFSNVTFTDTTYESLKKCKYLSHLNLVECTLNQDELLVTILEMKYLTEIIICRCYEKDTDQFVVYQGDILEKCRHVKICCLDTLNHSGLQFTV